MPRRVLAPPPPLTVRRPPWRHRLRILLWRARVPFAAVALGLAAAATVGQLRAEMRVRHGAALERVLARSAVLSEGVRLDSDDLPLRPDAVVDVLPPFAGG